MIYSQTQLARLRSHIRRWGIRLRLVESLTWGAWGAAAGLGAAVLLALAARLWPLWMARQLAALVGPLILGGTAVGALAAWLWPRSLARLARLFDRRFGLAERLTTALEIGAGRLSPPVEMAVAQLADTLSIVQRVDLGALLPLRAPRRAILACGLLAAALLVSLWLPNPQELTLLQREAVQVAIEEQIEDLETLHDELAGSAGLTEEERERLLRELEEAIAALEEIGQRPMAEIGDLTEAAAALSKAESALSELQDPGAAGVREGLERAAREMADSELTRRVAEALAQGDYQAAAEALAAFAGDEGEALTRDQELALAQELAQAAQALAESDPDLAQQLAQAAEEIEQGDVAQAREAIQEAARQMGAAGERVQRQETVEGTLAELQEGREQIAQAGGA